MTNPQPTSYLMGKNYKHFLKTGNKTEMSAFTTLIQDIIRSPSHNNQARRRNKRHLNWKGRSKIVIIYR